ncbi:hypothetical protein [Archangium sp.]|uniref:hypothetical protein n=1 Tax=Archangium sp. TaxID=1872627 RepID=UPI002D5E8230|nr:hypothetical protein [Archangium sp.]HYO58494.1 hypothetical protein [Archangium sp.]
MPTRSPSQALVRLALLLPLLSLACDSPAPPTTPDLPQVSIIVDAPNSVGKSLKLTVFTSGCDQVQGLELLDSNEPLKQVTHGGPSTVVELGMNEIRYTRGLAARLSLTARVTCADGRTNVSQAQPATFFPVAEVVEPINSSSQVVPDYFVAEGSGANVTFIGCGNDSNGRSWLYEVSKSDPANPRSVRMPIPCDETTYITDRKPTGNGHRWVWTLDKGAFALGPDFTITGTTTERLDNLAVAPDGNAFISIHGANFKLRTPAGEEKWARRVELPGLVFGEPLVRAGETQVLVPLRSDGADSTHIQVGVLKYSDGTLLETYDIESVSPIQSPPVAFDASGTVLYLSVQGTNAASIRACALGSTKPCMPSMTTLLWESDPLQGYMVALVPYANGSRLAAITTNRFWFLDVKNGSSTLGECVNKDQLPLTSNGALVARFAQPGPPGSSAFYMFNSAAGTTEKPNPYPVEIVATDAAEKGELFRYQVPGGSLYGALDDSGELWMRVGSKLVKPLSPAQYRELR